MVINQFFQKFTRMVSDLEAINKLISLPSLAGSSTFPLARKLSSSCCGILLPLHLRRESRANPFRSHYRRVNGGGKRRCFLRKGVKGGTKRLMDLELNAVVNPEAFSGLLLHRK